MTRIKYKENVELAKYKLIDIENKANSTNEVVTLPQVLNSPSNTQTEVIFKGISHKL